MSACARVCVRVCACARVCARVCVCMYVRVHVCMCACTCACVCEQIYACTCACVCLRACAHVYCNIFMYIHSFSVFGCVSLSLHVNTLRYKMLDMGWLQLVSSLKLQVFFAKETYKRDNILQKRPIISRNLLIAATP